MSLSIIYFIIGFLNLGNTFAGTYIVKDGLTKESLFKSIEIIEDYNSQYTIEEISNLAPKNWKVIDHMSELVHGHNIFPYWIKIKIKNSSVRDSQFVLYPTGFVSSLEYYVFDEKSFLHKAKSGPNYVDKDHVKDYGRYGLILNFSQSESRTVYIKYMPYYSQQLRGDLVFRINGHIVNGNRDS